MIIIKFGGHAMNDTSGLFAAAVQSVLQMGQEAIIVHGGGPQIDRALDKAKIVPSFSGGYRITSPEAFQIVQSVLRGEVLPQLVGELRKVGINALGITGRDGGILVAERLKELADGTPAELGEVGSVLRVDTSLLETLLAAGFLPVLSPIAVEGDNESEYSEVGLNVNADLAAGAIAGAMQAESLIFMTDVAGIYRSWPDTNSLISTITAGELSGMLKDFSDGMAPKVFAALHAIQMGARSVRVIDGRDPEAFALALRGIGGTLVTQ